MTDQIPVLTWTRRAEYSSIWLKYVNGVNLSTHCIESLVGGRQKPLDRHQLTERLELTQHRQPLAWYLCGVTYPYRWTENAHLAFEYVPGATWEGEATVPGLLVKLENCLPIEGWGPDSVPEGAEFSQDRQYATCRNWQFAWWLRQNRDAPVMVEQNPWRRRNSAKKKATRAALAEKRDADPRVKEILADPTGEGRLF